MWISPVHGGPRYGIPHLAGGVIGNKTHRVNRFAGRPGRHQHAPAGQVLFAGNLPTGRKCLVDTFDRNFEFSVEHVALAKRADAVLLAPASANVIGKIAAGIADDMLGRPKDGQILLRIVCIVSG